MMASLQHDMMVTFNAGLSAGAKAERERCAKVCRDRADAHQLDLEATRDADAQRLCSARRREALACLEAIRKC